MLVARFIQASPQASIPIDNAIVVGAGPAGASLSFLLARRGIEVVLRERNTGIFAMFGAPLAHEDHPQRALYAAIRMQEELKRYSAKLAAEGANPLQCRVGINTGEVVVRSIATREGHTEYTPIGHTANLASRMQAIAPVGSIAVAGRARPGTAERKLMIAARQSCAFRFFAIVRF